ncbi:hypothetical protein D9758_013742 [Tetrapyrgos nigripes]|uniref:F-box domain-containing protein n=1 Tax=Tetrapyrgos nigripes TaxID=182062 RepID=A0A8H5G1Q9_9AGAR|nr:hypothetical protein D9758_013742 [Tetrapyrgos nigripes]
MLRYHEIRILLFLEPSSTQHLPRHSHLFMSRKRRTKAGKKPRPIIHILPNEVLMEVMKVSPAKEHAMLLLSCKLFYQLGRTLLYRSIWLTTFTAISKLHRTLFSPGGNELATQVRRFEVLIRHGLDWQTHPMPNVLINMLGAMRHVHELQLHIEHEFFSHLLMGDPFELLSFPNLSRLAVTLIPTFDHTSLLRFLQRHPSLTQLSISVPSRNFFLYRPFLSGFTETIKLPQLRSYSGPLEILNLIFPTVIALQSIVIDFGLSTDEDVEADLKRLQRLDVRSLSVELIVNPRSPIVNLALQHVPKNVTSLSFQYISASLNHLVMLGVPPLPDPNVVPLDVSALRRLTHLKSFFINDVSFRSVKGAHRNLSPELQKLIEACPSLETIKLHGRLYRRNAHAQSGYELVERR